MDSIPCVQYRVRLRGLIDSRATMLMATARGNVITTAKSTTPLLTQVFSL